MSLHVVTECIIWHLILLSSRNSDNKRRKWVCCGIQSSQLFRSAGTGFLCCYPSGHWKQKPTQSNSAALPEAKSKPTASNKCQWWGQVKSLGFIACLIKTSHPRKIPTALLHPWTKCGSPRSRCLVSSRGEAPTEQLGAGARGEFPVSQKSGASAAAAASHFALHLKEDHPISFTEVNINFFVVVCCKAIFWQDWQSLIYCCNVGLQPKQYSFKNLVGIDFSEIIIYPLKSKA